MSPALAGKSPSPRAVSWPIPLDVDMQEGVGAEVLGDPDLALPVAAFGRKQHVLRPHADRVRTKLRRISGR